MTRTLLNDLYRYFSGKENPNQQERDLLFQLKGELPHFHITGVHRDDLVQAGFDTTQVSDAVMERIAVKMANDYCEQLYWTSLVIIAEEYFHIPKAGKSVCPNCSKSSVDNDAEYGMCYCNECNSK